MMNNKSNYRKGELTMDYEEFKDRLQHEIQSNFVEHINFTSRIINKTNERLESIAMRFDSKTIAPEIYPLEIYEIYKDGAPVKEIADRISELLKKVKYPKISNLTLENAKKNISFSLINKDMNRELLKECPYKDFGDLAAIPRWHISDTESFLVDNNVMQKLRMTKEEIFDIAQKNTENADYICKDLDQHMKETMQEIGIDEEVVNEMMPNKSSLYILTNRKELDGSCAVLSAAFMQKASEEIGADELYILPSSRHEMLAIDANIVDDPNFLKLIVMDVNSNQNLVRTEDFLSDSVYKYNAHTHCLSLCDSEGLFHSKSTFSNKGQEISKRGKRIC